VRTGGWGKHIQICLCRAQSALRSYHCPSPKPQSLKLPLNAERKRLGRREGGEKSKQNVKIRLLFSETETAKQNQKFPFHFFFRFAVERWGEETRGKCKEIFLGFAHARPERVRGAHHWSSGFNSKYIRTSFNTHRTVENILFFGKVVYPKG